MAQVPRAANRLTGGAQLPMARVSHSVLHPEFIAEQVAQRYELGAKVGAFLLYRGMNDVYLIRAGEEKYALRVWRKTWRDVDAVAMSSTSPNLRPGAQSYSASARGPSGESALK